MIKTKSLKIVEGAAEPAGSIKSYINENFSIFILDAGDLKQKALVKLEKRNKELLQQKATLEKKMSVKDYDKKTPEDVRKKNAAQMEKINNELTENQKSE